MEEEIKKQFDELGVEPSDDVLGKCLELCIAYNVDDAEEFVEQWMSFSISHLNGEEPTLEYLNEFERKVFQVKREKELAFASKKKQKSTRAMANLAHLNVASTNVGESMNPLAMYGVQDDPMDEYMSEVANAPVSHEDDVLDTYNVVHTPKAKSSVARTPARHNEALFSPASYSPMQTGTPRSHSAALSSGKIVYTFGKPSLIASAQWCSMQQPKIHVKQLLLHNGEPLAAVKSKYMFDNLLEKCELAGDRVFYIGKALCQKVFGGDADDYELHQVDMHSQDTVKTVGTICCDHDGPLDPSSTILVGSDEMTCRTVRLNFSKVRGVGVFPGQVVIVSGINPKGDIFMVDEVHTDRQLDAPAPPKIADQLSFVVASGPFTHDDDLIYDPLNDLMTYLQDNKPDVLILTGPFLEASHKLIEENVTLAETFESFFEKMIAGIVEKVGTATTILVVASHRDANADCVYPTAPMTLKKTYANVHMLPDPSMVDLNGIVVGITSTDVMSHIIKHELAVNAGDKVKRIVSHLFNQGTFYPLNPPDEQQMCFDSVLASKYANIENIPNVLILPSDQKCFIRVVNNCLTINPGRLADNGGGTFARFIITPPAPKDEGNIFNYVGCQIRKV